MVSRRSWCVVWALLVCSSAVWGGKQFQAGAGEETAADQLIVRLQAGANIQTILSTLPPGISEAVIHSQKNLHLLKLPPGLAKQLAGVLAVNPAVDYVEPNHIRHASIATPNDGSYSQQWALSTLNAMQAWSLLPGQYLTAAAATGQRIKVAVLDTGIDCTHPDFKNPGATSADAAAGGQIGMASSRAFVASSISSTVCSVMDDHGHGTHVAGTIAAATQNGTGVASVAWPVEVVAYKVLDGNGSGSDSAISQAIMAAEDAGIPIVSLSLGGAGYSQSLQDAVSYAWARETLVIAAAGNASTNALTFPAGANYAVGVSATDSSNSFASFSNYGSSVDVAAPGVGILSTSPTYTTTMGLMNYGTLSGTSMATPHVAAVAGLIAMANPGASAAAIAQRLQQSAQSTNAGGGWNQNFGYGVVNAFAAVAGNLRAASVGGITGQVVDAAGLPVSGATVAVPGQSTVTAQDGLFRFANLSPGSYNITGSASGYPTVTIGIAVGAGADTSIAVPLAALGRFTGTVTARGVAVQGAVVEAVNGTAAASAITDAAGNYTLTVAPGTYTLRATALGATGASTGALAVLANGTVSANLTIARLGTISGTVRDGSGNAVASATITIAGGGISAGASTDASGHYQTIGLPAGSYTVTSTAAGLPTATVSGTVVAADSTASANLVMGSAPSGPPTTFSPIRVNAGGGAYTDTNGNAWSGDTAYSGGATWSVGNTISNTSAQALYQTCRYGSFGYNFPVPNGTYTVNLKFAEISLGGPGQRMFNATINGSQVLSNFDIFAQAGGMYAAVDAPFTVNVTAGQIAVQFSSGAANLPLVSAIEITQGPAPAPLGATSALINAGGAAYTDGSGQTWSADSYYSGGSTWSVSNSIANTNTPALYQTCRYGSFTYTVPVSNGSYTVTLKFAEPSLSGVGARQFNVTINGSPVLSNFDIFAQAGGMYVAVDRSFPVTVTNGQIVVQFTNGAANLAMVNAIQVTAGASSGSVSSYAVNAGGAGLIDASSLLWSADVNYSGGATWSVTSNVANTATPALYQTCRYGNFSYNFPVANGSYNVTLKFAEITHFGAGRRVFNVSINGSPVLTNFDIYAQAGGALIAIDKSFPVTVTGGVITVQFSAGAADLPMVNAIQVQ